LIKVFRMGISTINWMSIFGLLANGLILPTLMVHAVFRPGEQLRRMCLAGVIVAAGRTVDSGLAWAGINPFAAELIGDIAWLKVAIMAKYNLALEPGHLAREHAENRADL
jgi:hypothetical protein